MSRIRRAMTGLVPREQLAKLIEKGLEWQFEPRIKEKLEQLVEDEWKDNTLLLVVKDSTKYQCHVCKKEVEAYIDKYNVHWCPSCRHPLKSVGENKLIGSYLLLFSEGGKKIEFIRDWHKYNITPTIIVEMTDDTLFDIVQGRRFPNGVFRKITPYEAFCAGLITIDETVENWFVHIARLSAILEGIDEYLRKQD